jgi:Protein of unknown function (DUF992)
MFNRNLIMVAAGLDLTIFASAIAPTVVLAQPRIEVGMLNCRVAGGTGFIVGSTKRFSCRFQRQGRDEFYVGQISRFGIDVGTTNQSAITWAVFAPTNNLPRASLNGTYGGVSGEATIGLGVGANALVGGSSHNIILQPFSVQSQQGLNIAAGIAAMNLIATRRH